MGWWFFLRFGEWTSDFKWGLIFAWLDYSFQSSAFAVLLFAHFLRLRYHMSENTRKVFSDIRDRLDKLLLSPQGNKKIPPAVQKAYNKSKTLLTRYGGSPIHRKTM